MNNMDEITYWIYTKRAPCLMNYDDDLLKKNRDIEFSKLKTPLSISDDETKTPSPRKRKRKLSLLEDNSVSPKRPENIFFDSSKRQQGQRPVLSSCKSSDVHFNIKKSLMKEKTPRKSLQKNGHRILHKKNTVVTSTPKVFTNLRRSLRRTSKSFGESNQINRSLELLNGNSPQKLTSPNKTRKQIVRRKPSSDEKRNEVLEKDKANGKFDNVSDVSGFTANYIRSTKIHCSTDRKTRKMSRNLLKESRQSLQKDQDKTVVCVNKSMNTGHCDTVLTQSTASSQNVLNLVTTTDCHQRPVRLSRTTSLLKFIESKAKSSRHSTNHQQQSDLNQSTDPLPNRTSRYPTRYKNNHLHSTPEYKVTPNKKEGVSNDTNDISQSDRKENPEQTLTRTRSGRLRFRNSTLQRSDGSILVLSNVTEPVSSAVSVNVASPDKTPKGNILKNDRNSAKTTERKASRNVRGSRQSALGRHSMRDPSGCAGRYSESDEDVPLKTYKYFC